jgi:hypothetical protein
MWWAVALLIKLLCKHQVIWGEQNKSNFLPTSVGAICLKIDSGAGVAI